MQDEQDNDTSDPRPLGPPASHTGYKAPPAASQFRKGKSGNPKGRPKGAQGKRKIAEKVLFEEHDVVEGGRIVRHTTLELILIALRNEACTGNSRAYKAFEKLDADYDPQKPAVKSGSLVVPGRLTKESWVKLFSPPNDPTQKSEDE